MNANVVWPIDSIQDHLIMLFVSNEIKLIGIQNQDAHVALLLPQEFKITLLNVVQIIIADSLFVATSTFANVFLKPFHIRIQINQQFRFGHIRENDVEETREQLIFQILQVIARKNQ